MIKYIYNIHNTQGALLMQVVASTKNAARRQARKTWSGPIVITKTSSRYDTKTKSWG